FQRQSDVWDLRRKKLLIDSILKKWRIPKLYLTNVKSDVYGMIDGQQRIGSILEFVNDGFGITSDASGEEYKFSALGQKDQETILNYPLDIEMITDASQEEQSELFSRLQEGMELNTWEKLNAITGKLADFIGYMEKHDFFSKTALTGKDTS
ncbi:MAG TPA: DUF262 domain-containing protein, partial [Nitrososphaera sp.]|nr:DUF262 domain-containing protein [Nitrososphaera sp.]